MQELIYSELEKRKVEKQPKLKQSIMTAVQNVLNSLMPKYACWCRTVPLQQIKNMHDKNVSDVALKGNERYAKEQSWALRFVMERKKDDNERVI